MPTRANVEAPDIEEEVPLDSNFIEQAEYIPVESFEALHAVHPDEESIVRRLSASGAKLLVGPRGCGKTTLMLKAYYSLLQEESNALPVYVNFKLSLKLEPLYQNTPNASFWFRSWLILKIYEGLFSTLDHGKYKFPSEFVGRSEVTSLINSIEGGRINNSAFPDRLNTDALTSAIQSLISENGLARCVLLLDDAAHAFSPRQQEDFFEFFRQIKSREISPKAAIYPGITAHSPTFHVGHDAEQIDAWVRPNAAAYLPFMRALAAKRFGGEIPASLTNSPDAIEFLAYASFGIPRSFLNMLRAIYHDDDAAKLSKGSVDRRKLLEVSKHSRESAHGVYDSLKFKLPAYKEFVKSGTEIYSSIVAALKNFNRDREDEDQAWEVGIRRPIPTEFEKVLGFYQYAGLLMPAGENSRGVKGVFELYLVHFGDLITENALIGRRSKSISAYVKAFSTQTHQAWPRLTGDRLVQSRPAMFRLSLPNCQICGADRPSEEAKFCPNCGAQLKTASLYDELTRQEISVLPLSARMVKRIRDNSNIRTVRDILIDSNRVNLRSIPFIGPIRAARIAGYAEEHVA